jgi:serine/threonine protein kinase
MDKFWTEITPSQFAWEQEALEFIRKQLPDHEPYRAWSNFEFIADDGSINEVDLLVLTPKGFFLVEIKSRPGRLTGNAGTWVWVTDGREYVHDNPLILTNRKSKKLVSLLRRQKAMKGERVPFLAALVFCSAEGLKCDLDDHARTGIWLRDRDATNEKPERRGIIHALTKVVSQEEVRRFQRLDRPIAKKVSRALEEAGIRRSNKYRKVGQYQLGQLLVEEDIYQEWEAQHVALEKVRRRVRIYPVSSKEPGVREAIIRAAQREFQILEGIEHAGILRAENYVEHELGPALIFEHHLGAIRLDHYLIQHGNSLSMDQRLHLIRQIGESLGYAHQKRLIHRALSPQNILVLDPDSELPRLKILNWQTARRQIETTTRQDFTATRHVQDLVDNSAMVYLAPEVHIDPGVSGEELDIFSLGAIAYHIFSGQRPAESIYSLVDKLSDQDGLQISAVMDGAGEKLQELIQYATHRDASLRIDALSDFFDLLDDVEEEITRPDEEHASVSNPIEAGAGDVLEGGFLVKKRLGRGATSVAFLVEKDGKQTVLKLAAELKHNDRIQEEAVVLEEIRHSGIVALEGAVEVSDHQGLLLQFADKGTLADRIRKEGRIHSELLERFGTDLLQAINHLEEHGISHRDIKPGNVGLVESGSKGKLHLMLFDFSLARVSPENIRAGTPPYLDPFLNTPSRRRWDLHAERFAAAMTLYEMATGTLPKWRDGRSDPALLDCEVTIDGELFEPSLREELTTFFAKALAREAKQRFDTCEEMLKAFSHLFREVELAEQRSGAGQDEDWEGIASTVALETTLSDLPFSDRALSALERIDARTVSGLLAIHIFRLSRMRGVGRQTQKELTQAHRRLTKLFPEQDTVKKPKPTSNKTAVEETEAEVQSIDLLVQQLIPKPNRSDSEATANALRIHLGLDTLPKMSHENSISTWPGQLEISQVVGVSRGRISQILGKARERWAKRIPTIRVLREEISELLAVAGGVMTLRELGEAVLVRRGSAHMEPERSQMAQAVTRAALEVERGMKESRWVERRGVGQVLIALDEEGLGQEFADYALNLGKLADDLSIQDPLPTPARVVELLQAEHYPNESQSLAANRLLKLAVATSKKAALSSRMEIYPKGLSATRALKLAQGALLGAKELTISQVRERVEGRYPDAEPLPDRPKLDKLLNEAGCRFEWNSNRGPGKNGIYIAIRHEHTTLYTSLTRYSSTEGGAGMVNEGVSPEEADSRAFQKRLDKAAKEGSFLALRVPPKHAVRVEGQLKEAYNFNVHSMDALFLSALRAVAEEKRIKRWEVILDADAEGNQGPNWRKLMGLIELASSRIEQQLIAEDNTVLLTDPGLLARYGKMDMVSRLLDQTLRQEGLQGLWMLIPSDDLTTGPAINGEAVPVITPSQWARVPDVWIHGIIKQQSHNNKKEHSI